MLAVLQSVPGPARLIWIAVGFFLITAMLVLAAPSFGNAQTDVPEALQQGPTGGAVPGNTRGTASDAEMWRAIRQGVTGSVSIPDKNAATLVQSEGDGWREFREGPLVRYSIYAIGGTLVLLILFFLLRGRIRIDSGWAGITITRFRFLERMGHWLLAISFIILGLTGLLLLLGRHEFTVFDMSFSLIALIGKDAFAWLAGWGKFLHNYVAFAFMAGLAWIFVAWVWNNIPMPRDLIWILKGGGLFWKGSHPPAGKFNAGQKLIFWLTILGGASVSLSGWALLFPYTTSFFADTFVVVNGIFGTELPTVLSPLQEQQLAALWHAIMSVFLVCVILAHIYIGSIGMQGAFAAMGSGEVDLNWAKEHHSIWVQREQARELGAKDSTAATPAE